MDQSQTAAVRELFKRRFGAVPAHVVHAPMAVELLGASAALPDSLCISVALSPSVHIASAPRFDGVIELVSSTFLDPERFFVDRLEKNPVAPWSHFPKSVLSEFRRRNVHFSGFSAAILDDIPGGGGLGRFAALQVATALTIRKLWPFRLGTAGLTTAPHRGARGELPSLDTAEKVALARLCLDAQKHFLGLECPLAEPLACLFGRSWHIVAIDLRFTTIDVLPAVGCVFVLARLPNLPIFSPVTRKACETAARRLGVKSLRSLETRDLPGIRKRLQEQEYQAVAHVVGEMARVVAAERALRNEDTAQFGAFLLQSHESSVSLQPALRELDAVVELTRKHQACRGARIVGQSVLCLVQHHQAAEFLEFLREGQPSLEPVVVQTAEAAA
jgi:galactokinase